MICSREIHFQQRCPSIQNLLYQVKRRTGIQVTYEADKWLVINPEQRDDCFNLYLEGTHIVTVINDEPTSDLLLATLNALVDMGGCICL